SRLLAGPAARRLARHLVGVPGRAHRAASGLGRAARRRPAHSFRRYHLADPHPPTPAAPVGVSERQAASVRTNRIGAASRGRAARLRPRDGLSLSAGELRRARQHWRRRLGTRPPPSAPPPRVVAASPP